MKSTLLVDHKHFKSSKEEGEITSHKEVSTKQNKNIEEESTKTGTQEAKDAEILVVKTG